LSYFTSKEPKSSKHFNFDSKEIKLVQQIKGSKRTLTTDQSQGKGLTSPSQTVDGKGTSNPLMAVALPKSKKFKLVQQIKQEIIKLMSLAFSLDNNSYKIVEINVQLNVNSKATYMAYITFYF
jgi:hypothetical protein